MGVKSGKQRRLEIKAARIKRAQVLAEVLKTPPQFRPLESIPANQQELQHNNTCGLLPEYYVDKPFTCRDCGVLELWTAKQQKWWYEVAKGYIDSTAVRCRPCRKKEQARKATAREVHQRGLAEKAKVNSKKASD